MKKTYIFILTLMMSLTFITFDSFAYDLYANDTPIKELNNLTLNEVFDDGVLTPATWLTYASTITQTNDDVIQWTSNGASIFSLLRNSYNNGIIVDDVYYVNGSIRALSNNVSVLRIEKIGSTHVVQNNPINGVWYDYSYVHTAIDTDVEEFRAAAVLSFAVSGEIAEINLPLIINMSDLGIDNLTQAELDDWYDIYQNNLTEINEFNERSLSEIEIYLNSILTFGARYVYDPVVSILLYAAIWFAIYKFLKGIIDYV